MAKRKLGLTATNPPFAFPVVVASDLDPGGPA